MIPPEPDDIPSTSSKNEPTVTDKSPTLDHGENTLAGTVTDMLGQEQSGAGEQPELPSNQEPTSSSAGDDFNILADTTQETVEESSSSTIPPNVPIPDEESVGTAVPLEDTLIDTTKDIVRDEIPLNSETQGEVQSKQADEALPDIAGIDGSSC